MAGGDGSGCAASHRKFTCHNHLPRFQYSDQIVKYGIHHRFIENTLIAKGEEIKLKAFHFDAEAVGHVGNGNCGEIRLAGDRTDAGKLGENEANFIIALGSGIIKSIQDVLVILARDSLVGRGNGAIFPQEL